MRGRLWSVAEIDYLVQNYSDSDNQFLCDFLNCNYWRLTSKAALLGLKKSAAFMAKVYAETNKNLTENGGATRFQKGHKSHNKGKKQVDYMSAENIEKTRKNQFKKGTVPHNYKPIGSERITIDGYTEIKVQDCQEKNRSYRLKNRVVYEAVYGKIPKDCVIEFLDGNKQNFDIENLVCRTRKENINNNMIRDVSIIKRQFKIKNPSDIDFFKENAQEIIKLKRSEMLLNRKINEYSRKTTNDQSV